MGDVGLLTGDLLLLILVVLLGQGTVDLPLLHALGVAAVVELGLVVLNAQGLIGHAVEEVTVVGDDHDTALVVGKVMLQPAQGLNVQMVGRLIEQQDVGLAGELDAQGETGLLSSAQMADGHIHEGIVKAETAQNAQATAAELEAPVGNEPLVEGGELTGQDVIGLLTARGLYAFVQLALQFRKACLVTEQGGEGVVHMVEGRFVLAAILAFGGKSALLGEDPQGLALGQVHLALGGLVFSRDHFEQGGLAAAVDADDAQLVFFVQRKGDVFKYGGCAEPECQVGDADDDHMVFL